MSLESEYVEVYALSSARSLEVARAFLKEFAAGGKEASDNYPVPQYQDPPTLTYSDPFDIIEYLEKSRAEGYSMYWSFPKNTTMSVSNAMIFFTVDGGMIVGLACRESEAMFILLEIVKFVNAEFGLITFEEPPPDTSQGFIEACKRSTCFSIVNGKYKDPDPGFA